MTKSYSMLLVGILLFLLLKIPQVSIRLSDTNVYFYTAHNILSQQLLYKDIFFTNLPLFPYIASIYQIATFGNLTTFYATALIEVIIITFLIFFIVFKKTKNNLISLLSSLLYIFSTIVLITSNHQIGVFTAAIFMLLAYIFLEKKNFLISGGFFALGLLTKAYLLPIVISFSIYVFLVKNNYRQLFQFFIGFAVVAVIILLPFLILAQKDIITDVFYSMTREGIAKSDIIAQIIVYDFMLFVVFIFNLINFKKNIFFALISLTSVIFIIFYQGLYYIYLNFIIPFLAISFYNLFNFLTSKRPILKIGFSAILILTIIANIILYAVHFSNLYNVKNINSIVSQIKKENATFLYGTPDITPALSYLSGVPLLDNIIDTNPNIFRKGFLDNKQLTQKAVDTRTILIAKGDSKLNITSDPINNMFDKNLIKEYCYTIAGFPINTGDGANRLVLLKCY